MPMIVADPLAGIDRIAIVRSGRLGDLTFALPALDALRATYPDAELVYLAPVWAGELLDDRPTVVDRTIALPPEADDALHGRPLEAGAAQAVDSFLDELRTERFDLALQLHGGGRNSNPFVLRIGARHTAGLGTPDATPLERTVPYIYFQSEIARLLEVVARVGARARTVEPELQPTVRERDLAYEAIGGLERPVVAIGTGASDPRRRWPAASFGRVGAALAQVGASIVLVGTDDERALSDAALEAAGGSPVTDLVGRTSLAALAGILGAVDLYIGNDSGPRHLADALGTATVAVYWCGNLINAGPFSRTRHRPLLSWRVGCPVCGQGTVEVDCGHDQSFVADVPEERVLEAAIDLLEQERLEQPVQRAEPSDETDAAAARAGQHRDRVGAVAELDDARFGGR
ncbi:MAG: glycosyltransferase family 9 protein [Chloroflexota bacterium]